MVAFEKGSLILRIRWLARVYFEARLGRSQSFRCQQKLLNHLDVNHGVHHLDASGDHRHPHTEADNQARL